MRKKKKSKTHKAKSKVEFVLTLSKYHWGQHTLDASSPGEASFLESMVPFMRLAQALLEAGTPLGTRIKITAQAQK